IEKQAGFGRQVRRKNFLECTGFDVGFHEEVDRIGKAQPQPGELGHPEMVVDDDSTGRIERVFAAALSAFRYFDAGNTFGKVVVRLA
ncbi:MAG: hypothetical protein KGL61_02095, partial [Burkholderiales bacterium]|nr:hypothetical protein [Burkholderiales bacterium]